MQQEQKESNVGNSEKNNIMEGGKGGTGKEKKRTWVFRGLVLCLLAAVFLTAGYEHFRTEVSSQQRISPETENNLCWLYQNTYILYRDLYNRKNQTHADYLDLYLQLAHWEEMSGIDDEEVKEQIESSGDSVLPVGMDRYELSQEIGTLQDVFREIDLEYGILNQMYGYVIRDSQSDYYVTNMSEAELSVLDYQSNYFLLSFIFDSAGNVTVGENVVGQDADTLRRLANQVPKNVLRDSVLIESCWRGPVDCTVTYVLTEQDRIRLNNNLEGYSVYTSGYSTGNGSYIRYYWASSYYFSLVGAYAQVGVAGYLAIILLILFILGCFLPVGGAKLWQRKGVCALPIEVLAGIGFLELACIGFIMELVAVVASGAAEQAINELFHKSDSPIMALVLTGNVLLLTLYFFIAWYLGICMRAIKEMGIKGYLRERSLIYRIFPYTAEKIRSVYHFFTHVDLTKDSLKAIRKIVLVNAFILAVISLTWLGGLGVVVVYSVVLYFLLKKYVSDIQKRYSILLKAVDEMAEGNLNVTLEEDLGVFEPFKPQVSKIQSGFSKAVEEEIKSQRMKAELITNVSHDLKTPLTAIITYVNLLKDPNLTEEQRQEYLEIMERKSLRLKVLIEDLFEVSKANSRSMTLNLVPVDIMNLIKQVSFEMKDKLEEAQLDVRMNLTDEKITLSLDSQKTYRVYENLFANVAKYALRGTRVYVNGFRIDDTVVITIKNISEQELTVDASELTERFVRGDVARNTEGSGLGLAIAKSFMEMQGGELELEVDGDLFKATTIWHI